MRIDQLFRPRSPSDVWSSVLGGAVGELVDTGLLEHLRRGSVAGTPDSEVAEVLLRQLRADLEAYGTDKPARFRDDDLPEVIRTTSRVTQRLGLEFDLPFRTYDEWRRHWVAKGCKGSWACRRRLVGTMFDEPMRSVRRLADQTDQQVLGRPVSPAAGTGWPMVDREIDNLRRAFGMAASPADYANIGNGCVRLTEMISAACWDGARHGVPDQPDPPIASTKARFDRIVDVDAAGPGNAEMRKLVRATIEFAQQVKHGGTPTRRRAGLAADSVIALANLLRRLREPD